MNYSNNEHNLTATGSNLTSSFPTTSGLECNWPPDNHSHGITKEQDPSLWVEIIVYPMLLFLCTLGNTLSIVVLSTDVAKTTTNVYLIFLAVSDLCVVWLTLPWYIPEVHRSVLTSDRYFHSTINSRGFLTWWQETAVQFSDWTLIVFSVERLIAIARPLEYRHRLTIRRAVYIELIVLFLAALSTLENLVLWYYVLAHDDGVSTKEKIASAQLRRWEQVQHQAEVAYTIGKWVILMVLNIILLTVLAHHSLIRRTILLHSAQSNGETLKDPMKRTSTIVLTSCVAVYFITQFPNVIYKILQVASLPPYCSYNFTFINKERARPYVFMCVLTNYSINFLLYCLIWKKFRNHLRYLTGKTLEKTGLAVNVSTTTTRTSVNSTPGGPTDGNRMAKLSLDSPETTQLTIASLLPATIQHPKLLQMALPDLSAKDRRVSADTIVD